MRLKAFQVKQICSKVLQTLRSGQMLTMIKSEVDVLAKMEEIFIADLKVEDAIDIEAEKILAQYTAKMGTNIDKQKMFLMIKKQLIKDRNIVI